MNKKEIILGFLIGVIANTIGSVLYILLFSDYSIKETYLNAVQQGHIGSILALGAILNLIAFFSFIKLRKDSYARGVLIATMFTALLIVYYKIF